MLPIGANILHQANCRDVDVHCRQTKESTIPLPLLLCLSAFATSHGVP